MRLHAVIMCLTVKKETEIKLETKTNVDSVKTSRSYWRLRENIWIRGKWRCKKVMLE